MKVSTYLYLHTIFCTSQHLDMIDDVEKMQELLHDVFQYYNCELVEAMCIKNHVHLLHSYNPEMSPDELLKKVKLAVQTKYQREVMPAFYWEPGYYVFSVSGNLLEAERIKILEQPIFHRRISLDNELKAYREELELEKSDDLTDLDEHRFN
jgi:REP element-mobilizing transposase RayT